MAADSGAEPLTVGRVAEVAGVTVRTLHHYDEIGLVQPSTRTTAGYRAYAAADVQRLRAVLAYRQLGFGLREIAALVADPSIDAIAHLRRQRALLLTQRDRAGAMVAAIDRELDARARGLAMTPEEQLAGVRPDGAAQLDGVRLYEAIGGAYPATRRTDPRIAAAIWAALGDARTVLNVGAGTGSYEPPDRAVTAVEPSAVMRAQRPAGAAACIAATAEELPFPDQSFDAAMAVSTVHHWADPIAGLRELRRVARRVVVLTWEASQSVLRHQFWLTRDYLPEFAELNVGWPTLTALSGALGSARAEPVLIPWDCADGLFEAYWRRPEAYLAEPVRRAVSVWTRLGPAVERRAVDELADDLASGRWQERNADVLALDAAELGLRLLVA